jgi:hypothetical protein
MATSEWTSASGLQMVKCMKRFAVGIVAVLALAGCGVGADETSDGQTLVTSSGQALIAAPEAGPLVNTGLPTQTLVTTAPSPLRNPGTVSLPQDPIPVYEGKTGTPVVAPAPR